MVHQQRNMAFNVMTNINLTTSIFIVIFRQSRLGCVLAEAVALWFIWDASVSRLVLVFALLASWFNWVFGLVWMAELV